MLRVTRKTAAILCFRRALLVTTSSATSSRALNPKTLFIKGAKHSNTAITEALKEHHKTLTFAEIANILFVSSKNHHCLNPAQLQYIVSAIQQKSGRVNTVSISKTFYGLKLQSSDNKLVLDLLRDVHSLLTGPSCSQLKPFNGQAIGAMVYGFQRMNSKHVEVRNMINYFTGAINDCEEPLSVQNISSLLYGIQNFDSEHVEVSQLSHLKTILSADTMGYCINMALFSVPVIYFI
jgi:hypothetical protein